MTEIRLAIMEYMKLLGYEFDRDYKKYKRKNNIEDDIDG